jgi:hypothetical protein
VFFSPNGTVHRFWRPTGMGRQFAFGAGSILEPLAAIKDQLIVVDGLDFVGASNHEGGMAAMLTGGGGGSSPTQGASIDQVIAGRLGTSERFPSLELSVQTTAWGGSTRDKLEAHVASLRQMEASLAAAGQPAPVAACTAPMQVTVDSQQNNNFPAVTRAQTDLLVSALACGMTRVASLQLSHTVSPTVPAWLNISEGHHSLSHMDDGNTAGLAQLVAAERWFAEQFRYLVERLAALPEPGAEGSMLDHSLVVWSKEMGDSRAHDCLSVPFVLAGRAGGYLSPGQYVRYDHVPHTRLLSTLAHGMGVELDQVGDGGAAGRGPLAGITA